MVYLAQFPTVWSYLSSCIVLRSRPDARKVHLLFSFILYLLYCCSCPNLPLFVPLHPIPPTPSGNPHTFVHVHESFV